MLAEKRPAIAIVEIDLEDRSGFDLASDLAMRQRDTRVVFYSAAMPDILVEQAMRSKASGYVLKTDSLNSLLAAVREVAGATVFLRRNPPEARSGFRNWSDEAGV